MGGSVDGDCWPALALVSGVGMNPQISPIDADSRNEPTHAILGAAMEVPIGANLRIVGE
jgi:hypothetical protein